MDNAELTPTEVTGFRSLLDNSVEEFIAASRAIGEPLITMANMVKRAFLVELDFIYAGLHTPKQPNEETFQRMTEPLSTVIREIQEFRDQNRHVADYFNHLSTVSESIVALSWISVTKAPVQFVRDMKEAGEYYGNRVLSTNRGDQKHAKWVNSWNDVIKALHTYVKTYHTTGFAWGASNRAPCVPPPPPPPSGLSQIDVVTGDAALPTNERSALLNDLNRGVDIVRMLKPVQRDASAPASRQETVEMSSASPHSTRTVQSSQKAPPQRPAKFFLDGKKWRVEHQKNNYGLVVENEDMSHSLAMFRCEDSGLEVRNKMNGAVIDNCKKITLVLNDIISSVEVIRCDRIKIQCNGHVPLISIDNSDSIQIFATPVSRDVEIISSKSSSCNICLLESDGDYVELPVPEQIKTVIAGKALQSTVVEKN